MENIVNGKIVRPFSTDYVDILNWIVGLSIVGGIIDILTGVMAGVALMSFDHSLGIILIVLTIVLDILSIVGAFLFMSEKKISAYILFGVSITSILSLLLLGNVYDLVDKSDIVKSVFKLLFLLVLFSWRKSSTGLNAWHILGFKKIEGKTVREWNKEYYNKQNKDEESKEIKLDNSHNAIVESKLYDDVTQPKCSDLFSDNTIMPTPLEELQNNVVLEEASIEHISDELVAKSNNSEVIDKDPSNLLELHSEKTTAQHFSRKSKWIATIICIIVILLGIVVCYFCFKSPDNQDLVSESDKEYLEIKKLLENEKYNKISSDTIKSFYTQAVEKKDTDAIYDVSAYYVNLSDYKNALSVCEKGYEFDSKDCLWGIARLYAYKKINENGLDNPLVDFNKAIFYTKELANTYKAESYRILGDVYSELNDMKLAIYYWSKGVEMNESYCMCNLAWSYENGNGCKVDYKRSYELFTKVLQKDSLDSYALYHLGLHHLNGWYVTRNREIAKEYIKKAANCGNDDAMRDYVDLFN